METLPVTGSKRRLFLLGSSAARERIWIQAEAIYEPQAAAMLAWAILDSLTGDRVSRFRHLVLGRTQVTVVGPAPATRAPRGQGNLPPIFDAGQLGAAPALIATMDRIAPTLVIHLQDWGRSYGAYRIGGGRQPDRPATAAGEPPLAGAGLRQVESFHLDGEVHEQISRSFRRRTWLGRPTRLARSLAAHPDARVGQAVRRYVTRMGFRVFDRSAESALASGGDQSLRVAVRLARGRYVPHVVWRRLQGASLCELALGRYGAHGLCGQTFDNPFVERIGAALAFAEGAIIYRLALESPEGAL